MMIMLLAIMVIVLMIVKIGMPAQMMIRMMPMTKFITILM
jgi:hypothetical protein